MGNFSFWHWVIFLVILILAFLPSVIAVRKNHPYKIAIILLNVFGGLLYGTGWLVALIWCFISPKGKITISVADEVEKLHRLNEKGLLTQQEFESQKEALLAKRET